MQVNTSIDYSDELIDTINFDLLNELDSSLILSPEAGIQKIRKILYKFGLDIPALYEASIDGDEVLFDVSDFFDDDSDIDIYLYIIYYQTDDGNYDFHSELVKPDDIEDFINDPEIYDLNDDEDELNNIDKLDVV